MKFYKVKTAIGVFAKEPEGARHKTFLAFGPNRSRRMVQEMEAHNISGLTDDKGIGVHPAAYNGVYSVLVDLIVAADNEVEAERHVQLFFEKLIVRAMLRPNICVGESIVINIDKARALPKDKEEAQQPRALPENKNMISDVGNIISGIKFNVWIYDDGTGTLKLAADPDSIPKNLKDSLRFMDWDDMIAQMEQRMDVLKRYNERGRRNLTQLKCHGCGRHFDRKIDEVVLGRHTTERLFVRYKNDIPTDKHIIACPKCNGIHKLEQLGGRVIKEA